jgi:hypothetical protein
MVDVPQTFIDLTMLDIVKLSPRRDAMSEYKVDVDDLSP